MISALIAVAIGVVALVGLTGKQTVPRTWMRTFMAGLPVVAVSGTFFAAGGWTLTTALAMTVSVVLGMLASLIGPASLTLPRDHWVAAGWQMLCAAAVAVVLGSGVVRWGASAVAPLELLSPEAVAVVIAVAAVAAAIGGAAQRGIVSTGTVIALVLFLVLVAIGGIAGAPATLADPLVPAAQSTGAWLSCLVTFVLAASNPALREIRSEGGSIVAGTIVTGVLMLVGLVALLSFNGGSMSLPSFSLAIVAGYVGFGSLLPGAVLCVVLSLVVVASAVVQYRSVYSALQAYADTPAGPPGFWRHPVFSALLIGVIAVALSVLVVPLQAMLVAAAVLAVTGWIVAWWTSRTKDSQVHGEAAVAGVDPAPVGQGTSS